MAPQTLIEADEPVNLAMHDTCMVDGSAVPPQLSLPALVLDDNLASTLASFEDAAGVTHRSISGAELEQAAFLLQRQHPANIRERQLAAEVIAAHAEQRLQFTWQNNMLDVVSWSSNGTVHHVNPISGCEECNDSQHCIHAVLHQLISIQQRGMRVSVRSERYGGYRYEEISS